MYRRGRIESPGWVGGKSTIREVRFMNSLRGTIGVLRQILGGTDGTTGGTSRERKELRVNGRGAVSTDPDRVVLTFGVDGRDESYGAAVEQLNRRVDALRGDLTEATGVGRENLKTLRFDVSPEYDYEDRGSGRERVFKCYKASHRLRVDLPLEKDLMNRALDRVAGSVSEATLAVSFDASDRDGLRKRALRAAVEDALGIARVLAEASGVKLGGIERVEHGRVSFGGSANREFEGFARRRESGADPDIEPSAVDAEVDVTLVYRIS